MTQSIAARFTARPAARFVRTPARAGERMLGLVRPGAISAARRTPAFLRGPDAMPVARLRRTGASPHADGRVARGPALAARPRMHWTRQDARTQGFRSAVASASWRA
jgi:hypothetical protein